MIKAPAQVFGVSSRHVDRALLQWRLGVGILAPILACPLNVLILRKGMVAQVNMVAIVDRNEIKKNNEILFSSVFFVLEIKGRYGCGVP